MSLLLHLNEEDLSVRQSCKITLKQLGPLLESKRTNEYVTLCPLLKICG